jgi:hypothetical protein
MPYAVEMRPTCQGCTSSNAEWIVSSVQIIGFYFELLTARESGDGNLILLPGSTTFLLLHGGEFSSTHMQPATLIF